MQLNTQVAEARAETARVAAESKRHKHESEEMKARRNLEVMSRSVTKWQEKVKKREEEMKLGADVKGMTDSAEVPAPINSIFQSTTHSVMYSLFRLVPSR